MFILYSEVIIIKVCSAFGHRELYENKGDALFVSVFEAYKQGCRYYYTGYMGDFDRQFAYAVKRLKSEYADVKLIIVKPYFSNTINTMKKEYESLFDDILIPNEIKGTFYKTAITMRNRWIIDHSDIIIFFLKRDYGGAYNALKYAKKAGKQIVEI